MSLSLDNLPKSRRSDRAARERLARHEATAAPHGYLEAMNADRLVKDNIQHMGDGGVSQNNREAGFRAAFRDEQTGKVVLARFKDGSPAPMHLLDGLPDAWVLERDEAGRVTTIKASVIAGFVRQGRFYTRQEAAEALAAVC